MGVGVLGGGCIILLESRVEVLVAGAVRPSVLTSPPVCIALCRGRGWSPSYRVGDLSALREALPTRAFRRSLRRGHRSSVGPAEWLKAGPCPHLQAHSVCSAALAPECTFGRLRTMVLPPACVRLLSRNFSKMHCFRISENSAPETGEWKAVLGPGMQAGGRPPVRGQLCPSHR